ncbi:MAG: S16 family serine protease [Thermodesulfobacteriota bacterium]
MFPIEFDHKVLDSLPLPGNEGISRVTHLLHAIVTRRVLPYFKRHRGTDPIAAAQLSEHLSIRRLEDDTNRIRCVSLTTRKDKQWTLFVHERVFDYFAFVIPSQPESRLADGTPEEHKVLAFAEFLLRHEIDEMLYPQRTKREILQSDAIFAMDRRTADPTFYRALREVFYDELNGLRGNGYLVVFNHAERDEPYEADFTDIINTYVDVLADLPEPLMEQVFPLLDTELKSKVLGVYYRRSRETAYPLLRRTSYLRQLLRQFHLLIDQDEKKARDVFECFKELWGVMFLFEELGVTPAGIESRDAKEIFEIFRKSLSSFATQPDGLVYGPPPKPVVVPITSQPSPTPVKSLRDRIEEAHANPAFPPQVLEVMDKNKLNAVGHSGSKYSELIETLLAIPWGKIHKIHVTSEEFEAGLNTTHYGLHKPKEIICDFFTNLIWRYRKFDEKEIDSWRRNGSAFLFVGPPGVGKTSLAISIAQNLEIPYHKVSLGGMRDEADLLGHGFTYEGSKPGAVVQGIIKMGVMNGMFIMDEADKTEKFATATLLEILDPEQNHLFHDKYTQTTVDIDLSNFHFVLTANTLETVPPPVINRCEVVLLDRYSIDEKVAIARQHLIQRIRDRHQIPEEQILFASADTPDLLRHLIKTYTHEAGVRELERIIRRLFLRIFRKEVLTGKKPSVRIVREMIKEYLETPRPPRQINEDDRIGEMAALGVNVELGVGMIIPIQATRIHVGGEGEDRRGFLSMVHATGNIQRIMDESRKVATTAILHCAESMGIFLAPELEPIHLHFMGASTQKDGPSAGGAIALALASVLADRKIRRDVAMTGEIDTQGRITLIGGIHLKLETAYDAGCKTVLIPTDNLKGEDSIERLSEALKLELQILTYEQWKGSHEPYDYARHILQIVAVDHIAQAADVALIDEEELENLDTCFVAHARSVTPALVEALDTMRPSLRVLYLKDAAELELETIRDAFWANSPCIFLVRPEAQAGVLSKYPQLEQYCPYARLWEFDPHRDDFRSVVGKIAEHVSMEMGDSVHLSIRAPFFFFLQHKEWAEGFGPGPSFRSLTRFANNYAVQGVKIKRSKPVLNQVYAYLAQLGPEHLDACPFLAKREGIYVADLSFIPEKYRLDVERAARLLNGSLRRWLHTVNEILGPVAKHIGSGD